MYENIVLLGIGYEAWLICDNENASKKFVAIENLVFGFELFIGDRSARRCPEFIFCPNDSGGGTGPLSPLELPEVVTSPLYYVSDKLMFPLFKV